jgi:hypothetical protein
MNDIEIGARALLKVLYPRAMESRWELCAEPMRMALEAITANGRAKIVRREMTPEMRVAIREKWPHGFASGPGAAFEERIGIVYDVAPAFDGDKSK